MLVVFTPANACTFLAGNLRKSIKLFYRYRVHSTIILNVSRVEKAVYPVSHTGNLALPRFTGIQEKRHPEPGGSSFVCFFKCVTNCEALQCTNKTSS